MTDTEYCDLCGMDITTESMKGTTYCSRECARLAGFLSQLRQLLSTVLIQVSR